MKPGHRAVVCENVVALLLKALLNLAASYDDGCVRLQTVVSDQ